MSRKKKKEDDLDTETTIVDMNVDGFKWYDPNKRKQDKSMKTHHPKVSRKEYWNMVRGAFAAYLPIFIILVLVAALLFCLSYIWLS